jgi:hypothetical protein
MTNRVLSITKGQHMLKHAQMYVIHVQRETCTTEEFQGDICTFFAGKTEWIDKHWWFGARLIWMIYNFATNQQDHQPSVKGMPKIAYNIWNDTSLVMWAHGWDRITESINS